MQPPPTENGLLYYAVIFDPISERWLGYIGETGDSYGERWRPTAPNSHFTAAMSIAKQIIEDGNCRPQGMLVDVLLALHLIDTPHLNSSMSKRFYVFGINIETRASDRKKAESYLITYQMTFLPAIGLSEKL